MCEGNCRTGQGPVHEVGLPVETQVEAEVVRARREAHDLLFRNHQLLPSIPDFAPPFLLCSRDVYKSCKNCFKITTFLISKDLEPIRGIISDRPSLEYIRPTTRPPMKRSDGGFSNPPSQLI